MWSSEDDMLISSFVSSSCSVEIAITYANHIILKQVEKIIRMPVHSVQHTIGNTNECCTGKYSIAVLRVSMD